MIQATLNLLSVQCRNGEWPDTATRATFLAGEGIQE
jgi:hypothetical protein